MTTTIGQFSPGQSWLYRLDPRPKLWYALSGIGLCLVASRIELLAGVLVAGHVVLFMGGINIRRITALWGKLALLLLIILVGQSLFTPDGATLVLIGPLAITSGGLQTGLRIALRVAGAAIIAATPLLTTPINQLVRGLEKVGLPHTWSMTVGLALRYLETLTDLYQSISEAQQARGWDVSSRNIIQRVRGAIPTLIAIVIASLRLSDSLALGMAARGFGLKRARTQRADIAMRGVDWAAIVLTSAGAAAALWFSLSL
jgi:energy-coupling factor transport system permease protein